MNLNKAIIIGRITKDIDLKSLPSGNSVASFSVATNHYYNDKDGTKQEEVEFHDVVFFGKMAETIAQYMSKGSEILVEGRIKTRSWEYEGKKHYKTEIVGQAFQFGAKPQGQSENPNSSPNTNKKQVEEELPTINLDDNSEEIDIDKISF